MNGSESGNRLRPLLTIDPNQNPKTFFWIGFGFGFGQRTDAKTMLSVFGKS